MSIVTQSELSLAVARKLHADEPAAEEAAERVLDVFGFHDQVIDNVLMPAERQLFYDLQEHGLVTTRSEETVLWNGQPWRTYYWLLRPDRVRDAARAVTRDGATPPDPSVYADLPSDCWARG